MTSLPPPARVVYAPPLSSILRRHAQEQPDRVALIDGDTGESATYAELLHTTQALGAGLLDLGVRPGARVAILAKNSKPYVELLWALAGIGAIAVPLNIRLLPKELATNVADAQVAAIVTDEALLPSATAVREAVPVDHLLFLGDGAAPGWTSLAEVAARGVEPPFTFDESGVFAAGESTGTLLYTSGTTGPAKGCALAQRTWSQYATNLAATMGLSRDDTYLGLLPYFHVAGLGMVMSQLILGGTVVTQAVPDPVRMHELVAAHQVTVVFVVPGISAPFVEHAPADAVVDGPVRLVIIAAGLERQDLPGLVAQRLGADCVAIYGQTEAGTKLTWATAEQLERDPGTYGRLMPGMAYRIVDPEDREVAEGAPGELVVRGPSVMQGYWNRPEATAEALRDGWHHTGDVFVRDPGGLLRMVDRSKYLIKTGGENVYPQEIENVLREHPKVADVAVGGVPDERWGEAVKAYVVLAPDEQVSRLELADWVRESVAGFKVPRYVEFVEYIPRNESGKVVKSALAERPVQAEDAVPRRSDA